MKKIDKLKAISKAFNSSETIDEFTVKLDLAGITLDDATKLYSEVNKDLVKHMNKLWTKNGVFSFDEVLKHANCAMHGSKVHIALPYNCTMKHYKDSISIAMCAMSLGGKIVSQKARTMTTTIDEMYAMHQIDVIYELISTLLYELSVEMKMCA